jgi:hypothetical protein
MRNVGKVCLGTVNSDGTKNAARFVGNAPEVSIEPEVDKEEVKDSTSPENLIDKVITKQRKAKVKIKLKSVHAENLALVAGGTKVSISSSSVTGELSPASLAADDLWKLKQENVSSVVITDSAGTPATLVLGTNYRIIDAGFGQIELINLTGFTPPLKAAYSYASRTQVVILNAGDLEFFVEFHGKNTANGNKRMFAEVYRLQGDPAKEIPLINDESATLELEFTALFDSTKSSDSTLGAFGRVSYVDAQLPA